MYKQSSSFFGPLKIISFIKDVVETYFYFAVNTGKLYAKGTGRTNKITTGGSSKYVLHTCLCSMYALCNILQDLESERSELSCGQTKELWKKLARVGSKFLDSSGA